MSTAYNYKDATLDEGKVEIGKKIRVTLKGEKRQVLGVVCETSREGKGPLRAVFTTARDEMVFASFENVSPGAKQKKPEQKPKKTGNPFIDRKAKS